MLAMSSKTAAWLAYVLLLAIVHEVAPRKLQQAPPLSHVVPRAFIVQVSDTIIATAAYRGDSLTQPAAAAAAADPSSAVLHDVKSANLDVKTINSFNSDIFKGIVLEAASDEAAAALLQHLNDDGRVANIFPVVGIQAPKLANPSPAPKGSSSSSSSSSSTTAGASVHATSSRDHATQLQVPAPIPPHTGCAAIAASASQTVNFPDVELALGTSGETVKFTPSQAWGTADLLTNVTTLRQRFGLTGKGIKIGIIDSGIDYTNPAFGSCTAINEPAGQCRVVAGYDFVGDDFQMPTDTLQPNPDPMDCSPVRHGTAVAGVAAAGYVPGAPMIGVAPEALIGAYKVYGCSGTGTSEALLAAFQRAVDDGMDIINLSLGEPSGYEAEPWSSIMQALYAKGILVIRSAGNEGGPMGGQGLFYADGHTAPGALVLGGANTAVSDITYLRASMFSSYGPDPELKLLPHITGPAEMLITTYSDGKYTTKSATGADGKALTPVSGTSFAAPYTAGALALALQLHRQNLNTPEAQGIAALQGLSAEEKAKGFVQRFVNDAVVRGARQLDTFGMQRAESTSKQGAGLLDITSLVLNPVTTSPASLSLPSNFTIYSKNITLKFTPQPQQELPITYRFQHRPAVAIVLPEASWGATNTPYDDTVLDLSASVTASPEAVTLYPGEEIDVQVTFSLPSQLMQQHIFYSGFLAFLPEPAAAGNATRGTPSDADSADPADSAETSADLATPAAAAAAQPTAGAAVTSVPPTAQAANASPEMAVASLAAVPALTLPVLDSDEVHGHLANSQREIYREVEFNPWVRVLGCRNRTVVPPETRVVGNMGRFMSDSNAGSKSSSSTRESGINQPVGAAERRELSESDVAADTFQVAAAAAVSSKTVAAGGSRLHSRISSVIGTGRRSGKQMSSTAVDNSNDAPSAAESSSSSSSSSSTPAGPAAANAASLDAADGSKSSSNSSNSTLNTPADQQQQQQSTVPTATPTTTPTATPTVFPTASKVSAVPIIIPYEGANGYSRSAAVAMPTGLYINKFCYTPNTVNVLSGGVAVNPAVDVMRRGCKHMSASYLPPIEVPLSQIRDYPCALSFTLAPLLPVRRMFVQLLDSAGRKLGLVQMVDTPSYSRSPAGAAYSYCLKWRGMYRPANSKPTSVIPGQVYGMRVVLEAPVAAADREAGMQPRYVPVDMSGGFKVVEG